MWFSTVAFREYSSSLGQTAHPGLYEDVMAMDTILFDQGFNDCSLDS